MKCVLRACSLLLIACFSQMSFAQTEYMAQWNDLRRIFADARSRVTFLTQQGKVDKEAISTLDAALANVGGILSNEPKGEAAKDFVQNLAGRIESTSQIINMLEEKPKEGKRLQDQLEFLARDTSVKLAYMTAHEEKPLGYVRVRIISSNRRGLMVGVPMVYLDEDLYDQKKPPYDAGITDTDGSLRLIPGCYIFHEKAKRPKTKEKANRELIGSQGAHHVVEWKVSAK